MKFYFILFLFLSKNAFSSSCCGGGSSSSMIITGDNKAEISLGYSYRSDLGQTNKEGFSILNNKNIKDERQNIIFLGEYQILELWQLASKFTMVDKNLHKSGLREKNFGLGDIEFQLTYEYLPAYVYSEYKPRGFFYGKLTIPTSKSLYDSQSNIFADVRGTGLYSLSIGNFLLKTFNTLTLKITTEWSHFFGKTYSQYKLHDYEKFSIPLGIAYTPLHSAFTFGLTDTFSYQAEKKFTGDAQLKSSHEYFWEVNAFINYSTNRNEIWSLSYNDSTLIGKNVNSPLYRTIGFNYSYVFAL